MSGRARHNRYYIETWGCQMNELDTQRMRGLLERQGLLSADRPEDADVVLLNSCSVREKAEHKVYSRLGVFRQFKRDNPRMQIGLCGCVAEQEAERALKRMPDLDFVLGTGRISELTEVMLDASEGRRRTVIGFPEQPDYDLDAISRDGTFKGMVTLIEGCNKKCTFCVVPTTRGAERCRPMHAVLEEVRALVARGFVEVELLGQTVNHWRDPEHDADFADMLHAVAAIPGVERLRFVTSYPRDFTRRMVEAFASHENISPYLHLPVQSGSNRVLHWMGRGYSVDEYRRLVDLIREHRPDTALSTDLIVGFPGETDEDFRRTLELVEEIQFASIFAFCYSPRPHTAAPRLPLEPVDETVSRERLQVLLAAQEPIQRELNEALVGERMQALVTGPGREPGRLVGRTPCHRQLHFEGSLHRHRLGSLVDVEIERALPHSLLGRPLTPEAPAANVQTSPGMEAPR